MLDAVERGEEFVITRGGEHTLTRKNLARNQVNHNDDSVHTRRDYLTFRVSRQVLMTPAR